MRVTEQRLSAVVAEVTAQTKIGPKSIRAPGKAPYEVTQARWLCWKLLVDRDGYSMSAVADAWGCHHTSIFHAKGMNWTPYLRLKEPRPRQASASKSIGPAIARAA